jgi:hypothetical protein
MTRKGTQPVLTVQSPPPRSVMRGDVRRGTALCIVDTYTFAACNCSDYGRLVVIGLAPKDLMDGDEVPGLLMGPSTVQGLLQGTAKPGTPYYLNEYGLPRELQDIPVGAFLVRLGVALSPDDLFLQIAYGGRKQSAARFLTSTQLPDIS